MLESNVLVSIIIPVFNVRPYLIEALDSVLHQSYSKLEILVIDDGSTDGSGKICDEYSKKDKRIRIFHQENKGLSAARNVGLRMMSGEVVAFLDSDDAYHSFFIEKMVNAMIQEKVDLVVCKYTTHHTTGLLRHADKEKAMSMMESGTYNRVSALRALIDGKINYSIWNKLYVRELWNDIRFLEGHVHEDIDATLRVFDLCKRINILDEPLYLHRKRFGSITDTHSLKNIRDRISSYSRFESFVKRYTPEIFTTEQLAMCKQQQIKQMTNIYILYSRETENNNRRSYGEKLRKYIIEEGKEIETGHLGFRTKTAYHMICFCPKVLIMMYPGYRYIRQLVWKYIGI